MNTLCVEVEAKYATEAFDVPPSEVAGFKEKLGQLVDCTIRTYSKDVEDGGLIAKEEWEHGHVTYTPIPIHTDAF